MGLLPKAKGFSLVELSIVIIVTGLITAGVVTGASIIKQEKLRSIILEYNLYDTAFNNFNATFKATPGDMPNAWDYWGSDCAASASLCNGNGNFNIPHDYYVVTETYELIKAWKHLSLAGFIEGEYIIQHHINVAAGVNIPKTRYFNGGWYMNRYIWWANNIDSAIGRKHRFNVGTKRTNFLYHAPIFKPNDAYNIDLKIDDGSPYAGIVVSHGGYQIPGGVNPNCVSGSGSTATYKITYDIAAACNMMMEATLFRH
ncbi:MAG: hypothetical protein COV35_06065 [Alphaproteobacteria bacterium CG11_big_fil_rev_8_21_14_0_20_39_49]|nr:MAG: hypothetical protein COV35_06065 [Alphaproteobacteria bacterium CG11_big_fil_rev_8_21_14_0_20_39_49]